MKRLIAFAARGYPKEWRARYGEEFETLLEDSGAAGIGELIDVMRGALTTRMQDLSGWRLAAAFGVAGMVAMAAAAFATPGTYRSTGTFSIALTRDQAARVVNQAVYESFEGHSDFRQVLDRHGIRGAADFEEAKKKLLIAAVASRSGAVDTAVSVAFDSRDSAISQAVAHEYMGRLMKRLESAGLRAKTIDEPLFPDHRMSPNWRFMMLVGLVAGLTCGGIAGLFKWRAPLPPA